MSRKRGEGVKEAELQKAELQNADEASANIPAASGRTKQYTTKQVTPEQVILARRRRLNSWEDIQSFFSKLIMMVVLLWILFGVLFGITPMTNNDMSPSISAGDLILYYRMQDKLRTDDVVVFEKDGEQYVGRIVGKGGETVDITEDAHLKINGSTVMETDIFYSTQRYESEVSYPVELAEDEFFILCDYREGARDSRYFGTVKRSEIKGKAITILRRSSL